MEFLQPTCPICVRMIAALFRIAQMFDIPIKSGNQLKFFLEPVAVSLNYLKPRYKEVNMAGLSGGGWTATLYAAVDPTIRYSFPVAGSIPLYLRTGGSVGDKEQYLEEFYRIAGYPDLYVLGAYGPAVSKFRS